MYKMTHGIYDLKTTGSLYSFNTQTSTRGHSYKLNKTTIRTSKFSHFFTNRIINTWNNLPEKVVEAGTVNSFKNGTHNV